MKIKYLAICCAAIAGLSVTIPVMAQTATASGSMQVQIEITANCAVTGSTTLDFGSQASTTAEAENIGGVSVTCTNLSAYKIGLQPSGAGTGGTGVMSSTEPGVTQTIGYQLFKDAARTVAWGNDENTNVVSSTGTGAAQAFAVYGKTTTTLNVPAAEYKDTVEINVYY